MTKLEGPHKEHSDSSETNDLQQYAEGLEVLPPWSEANGKDRLRIIGINFAVYFPVAFILSIALLVFFTMLLLYVYPLVALNDDDPAIWYWHSESELKNARTRGWVVFGLLIWFEFWLLFTLFRAMYTNPGNIPDTVEWSLQESDHSDNRSHHERRQDGDLRHCVICARMKPDRTHHCRLCDKCILKMDHHCPWIANCVGYYNYKYFFLLVCYALLGLLLFSSTFWETVVITLNNEDTSTMLCLYIMTVYSLGCILTLVLIAFFCFHFYLISNSMTTIEYCEKRKRWANKDSIYTLPMYKAWQEALGRNPLTWGFPFAYREDIDTGTSFARQA
mmetsp:Transcript_29439/g.52713  ORF Transcript_29439/g.52713 Transcript_29439/m.52713 type:complete len:333 (-) Transcript_29439:39-1037(-)